MDNVSTMLKVRRGCPATSLFPADSSGKGTRSLEPLYPILSVISEHSEYNCIDLMCIEIYFLMFKGTVRMFS